MYAGRVNPLTTFPNVGVAIFGQKTLQIRESLLDRINVRRMLLEVRKLVSNIAIRLVFEQNDQVVRDEFIAKVTPILDNIRRERGLFDFRVIMDDTLNTPESVDRNELYGEILLKPIASVEFIGIGFTITPSGASFDNI
jgi:phage tail sheath protein FI